jgi:hypothetical protein
MARLPLDQAARLTELGKLTVTRAIKCSWLSARRKHALAPWRAARLADLRADEELRGRVTLAEERLTDLKAALEDMRAQRDAWQEMAQARIRPARATSTSWWLSLRSTG